MTPAKELFIAIQARLKTIAKLELIDLDRNQFNKGRDEYPGCFTAALIKTPRIEYETLVGQTKEGNAEIEIILYCKDGWLDQHQNTSDIENGLIEIDLIDDIVNTLEGLQGISFNSLQQVSESENEVAEDDLLSFSIVFNAKVFKTINKKFTNSNVTFTPA